MFNFFRKKDNSQNQIESVEDKNINDINKKVLFSRAKDELLENPSFCILIQLNKETEEFTIAADIDDFTEENADLIGIFLSILTSGGANQILADALTSFPVNKQEEQFVLQILNLWKAYENIASNNPQKNIKNKIDPTKIFNIRGGNP